MAKRKKIIPHRTHESTPYEVLEVQETASFDEIRKAYLEKVRKSPPERDPENFKKIRRAYGHLKDAEKKRQLDFTLFRRKSGLEIEFGRDYDFTAMFKSRIFDILLESSDLYVGNFAKCFHDIDKEVEQLQ